MVQSTLHALFVTIAYAVIGIVFLLIFETVGQQCDDPFVGELGADLDEERRKEYEDVWIAEEISARNRPPVLVVELSAICSTQAFIGEAFVRVFITPEPPPWA